MNTIRIILLAALLFIIWNKSNSQNSLVFNYDKSGNLVERKLQVLFGARLANYANTDSTIMQNISDAPTVALKLYPNPTNDKLNIEGQLPKGISEAKLRLLNVNGIVLKEDIYTGNLKVIDLSDQKNGMYILELWYSKKSRDTYKIIITH